jgi:hypothetical protein
LPAAADLERQFGEQVAGKIKVSKPRKHAQLWDQLCTINNSWWWLVVVVAVVSAVVVAM